MRRRWLLMVCIWLMVAPTADAFTPMVDILQTIKVINALRQQYALMKQEYGSLKNQYHALVGRGHLGKSMMMSRTVVDWTPTSEDLLAMIASGKDAGSLQDRVDYYQKKFKLIKPAAITPQDKQSEAANYAYLSQLNAQAALVISEHGFDNAQRYATQIKQLASAIDEQRTIKQAMDLNSSAVVNLAHMLNDLLRVQAEALKLTAIAQQGENERTVFNHHFIKDFPNE